jgi:Flp pilus assembly protein TadG
MTTRIRLRDEGGQAIVVTAVFMVALLGAVALTLDVGSWYREHRQAQSTADAAALAGAQALPTDPAKAYTLASDYGNDNGGGIKAGDGITFKASLVTNDTVTVKVRRTAPGFFSKLFSISSVQVGATATARASNPSEVRWAAPIAVAKTHPMLAGTGCPCFDQPTTIPLGKNGMPGAFDLVNLDGSRGGTSPGILEDWIMRGFDGYLGVNKNYYSDPGAKFNSSHMQDALTERIGDELLFPIYDPDLSGGNGANAYYHVIGWVGFHLNSFDARGNDGTLSGYFTRVIWDGIQTKTGAGSPDFGVYSIALIN